MSIWQFKSWHLVFMKLTPGKKKFEQTDVVNCVCCNIFLRWTVKAERNITLSQCWTFERLQDDRINFWIAPFINCFSLLTRLQIIFCFLTKIVSFSINVRTTQMDAYFSKITTCWNSFGNVAENKNKKRPFCKRFLKTGLEPTVVPTETRQYD